MIKEIVKDEAVLSQPCAVATAEDASVAQDLLDTIASLDDAACLAANQIGETVCIAVYLDEDEQPHVMFNPAIKRALRPVRTVEACLSRDVESNVTRFEKITVAYEELVDGKLVARTKEFQGWTAQIVQHNIDHCKGKLV